MRIVTLVREWFYKFFFSKKSICSLSLKDKIRSEVSDRVSIMLALTGSENEFSQNLIDVIADQVEYELHDTDQKMVTVTKNVLYRYFDLFDEFGLSLTVLSSVIQYRFVFKDSKIQYEFIKKLKGYFMEVSRFEIEFMRNEFLATHVISLAEDLNVVCAKHEFHIPKCREFDFILSMLALLPSYPEYRFKRLEETIYLINMSEKNSIEIDRLIRFSHEVGFDELWKLTECLITGKIDLEFFKMILDNPRSYKVSRQRFIKKRFISVDILGKHKRIRAVMN